MDAGNEGVYEEHEDHHGEDGHALHQEHRVGYSVLLRRNQEVSRAANPYREVCEDLDLKGCATSFSE